MNKRLFVAGLSYSVTNQELEQLFSTHGTVESARVVVNMLTGQSRKFGFVEMSSSSEAQAAITGLNGTEYEGRSLVVIEAKPQPNRR